VTDFGLVYKNTVLDPPISKGKFFRRYIKNIFSIWK
jgi:hypothetical protein